MIRQIWKLAPVADSGCRLPSVVVRADSDREARGLCKALIAITSVNLREDGYSQWTDPAMVSCTLTLHSGHNEYGPTMLLRN